MLCWLHISRQATRERRGGRTDESSADDEKHERKECEHEPQKACRRRCGKPEGGHRQHQSPPSYTRKFTSTYTRLTGLSTANEDITICDERIHTRSRACHRRGSGTCAPSTSCSYPQSRSAIPLAHGHQYQASRQRISTYREQVCSGTGA